MKYFELMLGAITLYGFWHNIELASKERNWIRFIKSLFLLFFGLIITFFALNKFL